MHQDKSRSHPRRQILSLALKRAKHWMHNYRNLQTCRTILSRHLSGISHPCTVQTVTHTKRQQTTAIFTHFCVFDHPLRFAFYCTSCRAYLLTPTLNRAATTAPKSHASHFMSLGACSLLRSRKNPACVRHSRTVTVTRLAVTSVMRT